MKVEAIVFLVVGIFATVMGLIYGIVTDWQELVGAPALFLSGGLGFMVAFYFWLTGKRIGYRPDDNPEGEIREFEGEYGSFSPYSWWPLWLALTASLMFMGLAVGWWMFAIGAFFGLFALVGWTFEYFKGAHAN
ncbi:conserved membrane hypothetical protein [Nostocoides australiense Ben110]|uniref:Cytochrome c oxidase polypeptide 4 n=1 Tax=Nostocoides australiense Ben110 TaxID=1193182 RepID=W6K164_9MICO|nr:cytochrome c oxidase subunit 4 [Tetrasphaera australiensis]CCH75202.1 conserved membrane hypothetical protein [Tetrasphaera australiensis Ben110]